MRLDRQMLICKGLRYVCGRVSMRRARKIVALIVGTAQRVLLSQKLLFFLHFLLSGAFPSRRRSRTALARAYLPSRQQTPVALTSGAGCRRRVRQCSALRTVLRRGNAHHRTECPREVTGRGELTRECDVGQRSSSLLEQRLSVLQSSLSDILVRRPFRSYPERS